jgi:hypothetical protein
LYHEALQQLSDALVQITTPPYDSQSDHRFATLLDLVLRGWGMSSLSLPTVADDVLLPRV